MEQFEAGKIDNLVFTSDGSLRGPGLSWSVILWERVEKDNLITTRAIYGRAGATQGSSAYDAEAEALRQAVLLYIQLILTLFNSLVSSLLTRW